MSIARISDTVVQNLPNTILGYIKADKTNNLDGSIFESKSLRIRDIIDRVFPVMGIIDIGDINVELSKYPNLSLEDKNDLLGTIREALNKSASIAKPITSSALESLLSSIIADNKLNNVERINKLKILFSKAYYLTDSNSIKPDSYIFVAPNYSGIVTQLTNRVNTILKAKNSSKRLGEYLDLGHSAAMFSGTTNYAFNSPKLIATLFDIATSSPRTFIDNTIDLNKATSMFTETTGQLEYHVEVSRNFGEGFLSLFVSIGGSIVTYENSVENQARGSKEAKEKFGTNKPTLAKLAAKFREIQDTGIKGLFNTTQLGKIIRETLRSSGSPSALDHIAHQIRAALNGSTIESHKSTAKASSKNNFKVISAKPTITNKFRKLTNIQGSNSFLLPQQSTVSLLALLQGRIADQIQRNMGTGDSTSKLNYRSGRFANSVSIERLTTSREGMISVFYNYMRNPYGTFSEGGMQQSPRSRDPKTLISKSIREIGASAMYNRMRAVLV
jgi:hypothetical protein